jgi:superfamily II RNA helicase
VNHLVLQLIYERHLRDKYEEDSNRLHFYKIERDQLLVEKSYLEKNLKQLVEEYKNEIDKCLSEQNKVELNAYKKEIDEKDFIIR